MIVNCDGCSTKYLLADEKVPEYGIRVRCPKCKFVWRLTPAPPEPVFEVSSGDFDGEAQSPERTESNWTSMNHQRHAAAMKPVDDVMSESVEISVDKQTAVAAPQRPESPEMRKKRERAKRLARVFVSDILVYNREKRDQGLANGDLMSVLGSEIKKSWEAYKEKVGSEFVESSDYFREALNDILADGQNIF
jgi:predicted Zn finger-like uncharacterized protein